MAAEQCPWNLQREKQCKNHMVLFFGLFSLLHKYPCFFDDKTKKQELMSTRGMYLRIKTKLLIRA